MAKKYKNQGKTVAERGKKSNKRAHQQNQSRANCSETGRNVVVVKRIKEQKRPKGKKKAGSKCKNNAGKKRSVGWTLETICSVLGTKAEHKKTSKQPREGEDSKKDKTKQIGRP